MGKDRAHHELRPTGGPQRRLRHGRAEKMPPRLRHPLAAPGTGAVHGAHGAAAPAGDQPPAQRHVRLLRHRPCPPPGRQRQPGLRPDPAAVSERRGGAEAVHSDVHHGIEERVLLFSWVDPPGKSIFRQNPVAPGKVVCYPDSV